MNRRFLFGACVALLSAGLVVIGCSKPAAGPAGDPAAPHDHEHAHGDTGPHGGHLFELGGGEEYHAELTHDDSTRKVAIYVLDGAAKENVPIAAGEVTINLVANGQPQQYKLPAATQTGDPVGQSSRFEIVDDTLCESWDAPNTTARLNVTINGKPFIGTIEHHEHDHEHK